MNLLGWVIVPLVSWNLCFTAVSLNWQPVKMQYIKVYKRVTYSECDFLTLNLTAGDRGFEENVSCIEIMQKLGFNELIYIWCTGELSQLLWDWLKIKPVFSIEKDSHLMCVVIKCGDIAPKKRDKTVRLQVGNWYLLNWNRTHQEFGQ